MGRVQGLAEIFLNEELKVVKSSEGYVFSITIAVIGATAGDKIVLRDGTDGTGRPWVTFVCSGANVPIYREWFNGKHFPNGIVFDPALTGGGKIEAEMTFK